ncbi:MAG: GSCFA domain-containing protein [Flavobacterium sp.]|uniref:GSCFA domain-containing protein n=1 Tax=Flavobacterium sp. TaxID=239 RepID=UPI0022C1B564|nr:GSCFA domain-containing protein [Flavobacterium sp.]MCZ8197417.1 GSCFA domain-containing protein [Flavobacterium sp.]
MNFTTKIPILKYQNPIDYNSKILSLGSCFAENMGQKFDYFKFKNVVNPFGIIFNPVSIEKLIYRVINKIEFTESDIFFHNESWHCFEVHSDLSTSSSELLLANLNKVLHSFRSQIQEATHLILTYGTSWIYRNKVSNEIVANCHKVAQNQFDKEILSVETIEKSIQNTIDLVKKINPNCNFIFTISPVRHIKDGFVENQRSKAHLITALHSSNFQLPTSSYFPSYEILMDELRDYRFYADDMLHPSQTAIDYIWMKFFENYVDEKEFATMQQVCDIQKALHHKPFNVTSDSHQKFLKNLNQKINTLASKYPQIQF